MSGDWQDSSESDAAIVKVQGVPKRDDNGKITRRELLDFSAVALLLKQKLCEAGGLGEEYLRAKVAQESNAAKKIAEEGAELASKREHNEANAELVRQQAIGKFIENVQKISTLPPLEQTLALAKIFEQDSEFASQLEKVHEVMTRLSVTRSFVVTSQVPQEKSDI